MANDRDSIQTRLLANIDSTYDTSTGSFFYDVEKPVSIELESAYTQIDGILNKRYADTATGKDLDRIVKEVGLSRKTTTQASGTVTITGVVGSAITAGEIVSSDSYNFTFTETTTIPLSGVIDVTVQCTVCGSVGNVLAGKIKYFPKTLTGLQTVTNASAFTNGYDEEDDDTLRARYYAKVQTPTVSANKQTYKNWALSITGVGNCRVIPCAFGGGTVEIILINANNRGADSTLISAVKNYIDPNDGDGEGVAPIGAKLTVVSATEKEINITATLTMDTTNTTQETIISNLETAITNYLGDIAFNQNYVSYAKIGSLILTISGINDYSNLLVNSGTSNIDIADTEVAVLGGVTVG